MSEWHLAEKSVNGNRLQRFGRKSCEGWAIRLILGPAEDVVGAVDLPGADSRAIVRGPERRVKNEG
jgi:hypothetical protein